MSIREQEPVVVPTATVVTPVAPSRLRAFSPGGIIVGLLGVFLVFVGAVTLVKTGVAADVTQPTTTVFGITHTAGVGIVEIVAGVLLALSALDIGGLSLSAAIGAVALIAGLIGAFTTAQLQHDLGFGTSTAWFFVLWGALALVASMLPVLWHRSGSGVL